MIFSYEAIFSRNKKGPAGPFDTLLRKSAALPQSQGLTKDTDMLFLIQDNTLDILLYRHIINEA